MKLSRIVLSIALLSSLPLQAGVVNVGSGSYTTDHPGYDQAGRNKVPAGTPQLSGDAVGHPVPTNDWWSNVLYKDQSENIFTRVRDKRGLKRRDSDADKMSGDHGRGRLIRF